MGGELEPGVETGDLSPVKQLIVSRDFKIEFLLIIPGEMEGEQVQEVEEGLEERDSEVALDVDRFERCR